MNMRLVDQHPALAPQPALFDLPVPGPGFKVANLDALVDRFHSSDEAAALAAERELLASQPGPLDVPLPLKLA